MANLRNHIRYSNDRGKEFHRVLHTRIEAYLRERGKTRYADFEMWFKAFFFITAYLSAWALLAFAEMSTYEGMTLALLLGFLGTGIALNIGHDASHGNYSKHPIVNRVLYWVSMSLLGISGYLWKIGHLKSHHIASNIPPYDAGVEVNPIIRYTNLTRLKPFHRFQHVYAPLLYMTYTFNWVLFRDWKLMLRSSNWGIALNHHPLRYAELAAIKLIYLTAMIYLPLRYSSFTPVEIFIGYALMHALISLYVSAALFSTHVSDLSEIHEVDESGKLPHSFIEHQFLTVTDFHPTNSAANFLVGGFNAHLLHHLFPRLSATHSPALSHILISTAEEYGFHYRRVGIFELVRSHYRYLRKMGRKPTSKRLRVENGPSPRRKATIGVRRRSAG